jgi:hypothetical protein
MFELEIDNIIFDIIKENSRGYSKQCIRSALSHIEKAWLLKDIAPEMAIFCSITAEEEAATAIFIALRDLKYDGAKKIKFRKHEYKQALEPFIRGIGSFLETTSSLEGFPFENYQLRIEGEGKDKKLSISFPYGDGYLTSIPPLGFIVTKNDSVYHFDDELKAVVSGDNYNDILKHVKKLSALRNKLLYAQPDGIPSIKGKIDAHLKRRQDIVTIFMRIYALIYPYKEKALFVQQTLNAFLMMMGDIERNIESESTHNEAH